jgi:ubiquinone/menaquinone biosynthesis C-methylase UbiE
MTPSESSREAGFDDAYSGTPPWEIGRPQREFIDLAEAGAINGDVLDVGCGTGENALYLAERGHEVQGIDVSSTAIEMARSKAQTRSLGATFTVHDALKLPGLEQQFDTAIDCGLFHVFSDEERPIYAEGLQTVLRSGGRYHMLCFSEHEPGSGGPRRVSKEGIRTTFDDSWRINAIRDATLELDTESGGVRAYLTSITRL